jgi:hypothetical protein
VHALPGAAKLSLAAKLNARVRRITTTRTRSLTNRGRQREPKILLSSSARPIFL